MLREYSVATICPTTEKDTIYSLLVDRVSRDPDDLIAQWQDDETRQWHDVTAGQMQERVREIAKGLIGLGVKAGSMVVIYAATCYEWGVVDFACAAIGAVNGVCFGILLCWALQFAGPVIGRDTLAHTALAKALQAIDVLTLGVGV